MSRKKHLKITNTLILSLILIGCLVSLTTITTATETTPTSDYQLLTGLPGMPTGTATDSGNYLSNIFKISIGIAGVLAVIMIIIGGVMYMTVESIGGKGEAKKRINNAIFGLVLALSSYILLNTIDTNLVTGNLSLEPVEPPPTIPPDLEVTYLGMCKNGEKCSGTSLPDCFADCEIVCGKNVTYILNCTKDPYSQSGTNSMELDDKDTYIAKCDKSAHSSKVCGEGTTSIRACQASCKTDKGCINTTEMAIDCHKKTKTK